MTTYVVADCVTGVMVPLGLIWQLAAAPRSERFSTVDARTLLQNSHRSVCKKYCLVEWKQQVCINARPSASAAAELSGFLMLWRHPRPYKCMQHLVSKGGQVHQGWYSSWQLHQFLKPIVQTHRR